MFAFFHHLLFRSSKPCKKLSYGSAVSNNQIYPFVTPTANTFVEIQEIEESLVERGK